MYLLCGSGIGPPWRVLRDHAVEAVQAHLGSLYTPVWEVQFNGWALWWTSLLYSKYPPFSGYFGENLVFHGKYILF